MKYPTEYEQEDGWTKWVQPNMKLYKLACCDCGLIHDMKFRIVEGKIQFKARRNNRATGQRRRYKKT